MGRGRVDIPKERLEALNAGSVAASNLTECLAMDFATLLEKTLPGCPAGVAAPLRAAAGEGIVRRMQMAAAAVEAAQGTEYAQVLAGHASDTVRGWACFMLAQRPHMSLAARLEALRPLADDEHFAVREWAWLALRPHVVQDVAAAIALLAPWTASSSERVRRFATEATRPRGVWSAHIAALKKQPALGLPLLEPLRADDSGYVQDSVANWLNDASKSAPQWVRDICERWRRESAAPATSRICRRALRTLEKA